MMVAKKVKLNILFVIFSKKLDDAVVGRLSWNALNAKNLNYKT